MAFYREQYLNYIKTHFANYDYMLVIDFDLDGNQCIDGLFHSIACEPSWDAVFINGQISIPGTFGLVTSAYDALAYLPINQPFDNASSSTTHKIMNSVSRFLKLSSSLGEYKLHPVKSAFNGYGLYKIKSILPCSYVGHEICEHINLAKSLLQHGGRLFINPLWFGYFDYRGTGPGGPWEIVKSVL